MWLPLPPFSAERVQWKKKKNCKETAPTPPPNRSSFKSERTPCDLEQLQLHIPAEKRIVNWWPWFYLLKDSEEEESFLI